MKPRRFLGFFNQAFALTPPKLEKHSDILKLVRLMLFIIVQVLFELMWDGLSCE